MTSPHPSNSPLAIPTPRHGVLLQALASTGGPSRASPCAPVALVLDRPRPRSRALDARDVARASAKGAIATSTTIVRSLTLGVFSPTQVYPIFVAIGGAVSLCGFFCARQLLTSPGFTAAKSKRAAGLNEGDAWVKEGTNWREHRVRRALRSMYGGNPQKVQIFTGMNATYGGGQH